MNIRLKARLFAALIASLGCAPAFSAPSASVFGEGTGLLQIPARSLPADYLSRAVASSATGPSLGTVSATPVELAAGRAVPLAASGAGETQLSVFRFLAYLNAQQSGQPFRLADAGISLVLQTQIAPQAAVPLPGAAWFLVMGLLGLAGTRLTAPRRPQAIARAGEANAMAT
jgi:hypothetical protein